MASVFVLLEAFNRKEAAALGFFPCATASCNDNGIAENLPLNRMLGDYDIIHGTFFVCGLTSNDFTDLTPQQMKRYEELYHDPQLFFLLGKTLCVEHTTPEEYTRVMAPPPKTKESPER